VILAEFFLQARGPKLKHPDDYVVDVLGVLLTIVGSLHVKLVFRAETL